MNTDIRSGMNDAFASTAYELFTSFYSDNRDIDQRMVYFIIDFTDDKGSDISIIIYQNKVMSLCHDKLRFWSDHDSSFKKGITKAIRHHKPAFLGSFAGVARNKPPFEIKDVTGDNPDCWVTKSYELGYDSYGKKDVVELTAAQVDQLRS